jgi:cytochrome c5
LARNPKVLAAFAKNAAVAGAGVAFLATSIISSIREGKTFDMNMMNAAKDQDRQTILTIIADTVKRLGDKRDVLAQQFLTGFNDMAATGTRAQFARELGKIDESLIGFEHAVLNADKALATRYVEENKQ